MDIELERVYRTFYRSRKQGCFVGDRPEGEHKEWSEGGKLILQRFYKDGCLHGPYRKWNDDGIQLLEKSNYTYGQLDGEYKQWDYRGNLVLRCHYRKGNLHGLYIEWNYHNILKEISWIKCNKEYGENRRWNYDGKIIYHTYITDKTFYPFNLRKKMSLLTFKNILRTRFARKLYEKLQDRIGNDLTELIVNILSRKNLSQLSVRIQQIDKRAR